MRSLVHHARRAALPWAISVVIVIGCATPSSSAPPSASTGPLPAASPAASPSTPSSPMATTASTSLRLVGLGDSIAGAGHCGGCRSYVLALADLAGRTLGELVEATNLARNDDMTSSRLTSYVLNDDSVREALAGADIVTIGVGWNDWQGPCFWRAHATCLKDGQDTVERGLKRTLEEITAIRAGKPTAVRVVTYADPYRGDPMTPSYWAFEDTPDNIKAFDDAFATALRDFNGMLCRVAESAGARCVDLVPAFNGETGTTAMPDALRESQAQMDLIAETIDAIGYAPLR